MQAETVTAEISELLEQMDERPDDARELYIEMKRRIAVARDAGIDLPAAVIDAEQKLHTTFCALSQGR